MAKNVPIFRHVSVVPAGVTIDLTAVGVMGSAFLINETTATQVWYNFTAVPPAAAYGNGRKSLIYQEANNYDNVVLTVISFSIAAGAADVEVGLVPSSGGLRG